MGPQGVPAYSPHTLISVLRTRRARIAEPSLLLLQLEHSPLASALWFSLGGWKPYSPSRGLTARGVGGLQGPTEEQQSKASQGGGVTGFIM